MNKKTIDELEKELADLKEHHKTAWDIYGSELCAGDMIAQEENLEKEITKRKTKKEEEYINDVFQVLDSTTQPLTGIEQLHEIKEETTKRWKESGLLDGLTDGIPDNLAKMLESKDSFIINKENEIFTRIHVIDILNEFAFFLSDNGDPDTTGKEWLDMQYPEK